MLGLYGVLDSIASVRRQDFVDREENGANKRALASYLTKYEGLENEYLHK